MPTQGCSVIHVDRSTSSAAEVAAKTRPPMLGRMNVCTASLTVSIAGILSRTTSVSSSTAPTPMAHHDSIQAYDCGNVMTSLNRATRATSRNGM